jgi:hypothetical protein
MAENAGPAPGARLKMDSRGIALASLSTGRIYGIKRAAAAGIIRRYRLVLQVGTQLTKSVLLNPSSGLKELRCCI